MISVSDAKAHARDLEVGYSKLNGIKGKLIDLTSNLNQEWQATEMTFVNSAISKITSDIDKLNTKLFNLAPDIVSVAEEIRAEEEAAEAAARGTGR